MPGSAPAAINQFKCLLPISPDGSSPAAERLAGFLFCARGLLAQGPQSLTFRRPAPSPASADVFPGRAATTFEINQRIQRKSNMARGGARPNAGRKAGASSEKTREVANKVAADGDVTPLEVMVATMRAIYEKAVAGKDVEDVETGKVSSPLQLYVMAADVASKAAPFIHPKLSSVEMNANVTTRTLAEELAELNAQSSTGGH
jgi:hypothetical protein